MQGKFQAIFSGQFQGRYKIVWIMCLKIRCPAWEIEIAHDTVTLKLNFQDFLYLFFFFHPSALLLFLYLPLDLHLSQDPQ